MRGEEGGATVQLCDSYPPEVPTTFLSESDIGKRFLTRNGEIVELEKWFGKMYPFKILVGPSHSVGVHHDGSAEDVIGRSTPQYDIVCRYREAVPVKKGGPHLSKLEVDPTGISQHEPGAKLDAGKPRVHLCFSGFARALEAVAEVTTFGCTKYTENGWKNVPNGVERYLEAAQRHYLDICQGEEWGKEVLAMPDGTFVDVELLHRAQQAWNVLASLELWLQEKGCTNAPFATKIKQGDTNVEVSGFSPTRCY